MKTSVYEVQPVCSFPEDKNSEAADFLSPFESFEVSDGDANLIGIYAQQLRELRAGYNPRKEEIDTSNASEQYKELNAWNRERHNELVEALEKPYIELADRITTYAINNQHQLEKICEQVPVVEMPYSLASLPPNLFNHRSEGPFIPTTDEEAIRLVSEYMLFNRRLSKTNRDYGHKFMGSTTSQGFDVFLELQRRRACNDQTFTTEEGRQNWRRYSQEFQKEISESLSAPTLAQNATYVAYRNNRHFSETGGFFELADGQFESFYLAGLDSQSAFTSQIRVPVGYYGPQAAQELTLATYMVMELINKDTHFVQDIERLARDPEIGPLCRQHLLRSNDVVPSWMDPIEYGIRQTVLEGVMSVSATYGGIIEADGIPGYEDDLWEGLSATLDQQTATQITARMPAGLVAAQTIYGNYLTKPLASRKDKRIYVRPEVDAKWQQIRERRIALQHAAWLNYRESGTDRSPVRFGLYCPFKGAVVKKMAEALMVYRAIAHKPNFAHEFSATS